MDDVARDLARERLKVDLTKAIPRRDILLREIEAGTSLPYLSMRYRVPLADLEQAARVLKQRQEKDRERSQARAR